VEDFPMAKKPTYEELKQRVNELGAEAVERKRAREEKEEQLRFVQTLIDTMPSPVFYKDTAGKYTGCNKAFEEFVGRSEEEIIGKSVYDMGPKEIADKYYEKDEELFQNPGKQVYEWRVKREDGELRDVIFNKATFLDNQGRVTGLIGVILDITDRKRAEEALRESEKQRYRDEKRMEILKFANDVALKLMHNLRNPLVTIGGFSKRLSSKDYPEDKLKEYATVIFEGSMRLDKVLNEVLAHLQAAAEQV
jgi:PAS domain S-box-containing protein